MITEVDLVIWTKDGARTLPTVLSKIDSVIPRSLVKKKVMVDDNSSDSTRAIGQRFGWIIVPNKGEGISDGANTALSNVSSDFFVSFEQDLLLASDWWAKIPQHFSDPRVAVVSGVRLPSQPLTIRKIQEFSLDRYERRASEPQTFLYGKTLDNTIYRTHVVREIGGFPKTEISAGVDNILAQKVKIRDYEWVVDYSVRSVHLRKGLREELAHYYWYGTCFSTLNPILFNRNIEMTPMALRMFLSPIRGLEIALKKNAPQAVYVYPLMRLTMLKGISDGLKKQALS